MNDEYWMQVALKLAAQGRSQGEVPVGAVLVRHSDHADAMHPDEQIGAGFNCPITTSDSSAHAEIVALRDACSHTGNYRLPGTTLYVTLEPCMMCAGALIHARINRVVYGATEPKAGVIHSHPLLDSDWLNHNVEVRGGVLADQCGALLSNFFAERRALLRGEDNT